MYGPRGCIGCQKKWFYPNETYVPTYNGYSQKGQLTGEESLQLVLLFALGFAYIHTGREELRWISVYLIFAFGGVAPFVFVSIGILGVIIFHLFVKLVKLLWKIKWDYFWMLLPHVIYWLVKLSFVSLVYLDDNRCKTTSCEWKLVISECPLFIFEFETLALLWFIPESMVKWIIGKRNN